MSNKKTIKALEELVKTEYMAVGALDAALEEVDDNKLRKQYRKFRDSHVKQADALNDRIEDLGGEPVDYEVGSGKLQSSLWGKLVGQSDDISVGGMRIGAERGIKRYIDHIDEVDDPKALGIIRKNLEAKQDEMEWYDDQTNKGRSSDATERIQETKKRARVEQELAKEKEGGGFPFPLLLIAGAVGGAAYFLLKRNSDDDFDDFGEDAFRYEGDETTNYNSGSSSYMATSSEDYAEGATSDYNATEQTGQTGENKLDTGNL